MARRLSDADSLAKLQARTGGGSYPRGQNTAVDCTYQGEVTCALVVELPRHLWPPGATMYGRPIADSGTTRVASVPLLLADLTQRTKRPVMWETLVNEDIWTRAEEMEPGDRARMRQHAVRGYRFWFLHNHFSMSSMSALMNTRFTSDSTAVQLHIAPAGRGRPREVLLPGKYCVDPQRFDTQAEWRRALSQLRMGWKQDAAHKDCTYEVRQAIAGPAVQHEPFEPGFGLDSDDDERAQTPSATPMGEALDPSHVCYPTLCCVFARNKVVQMQHSAWGLSEEQADVGRYICNTAWQPPPEVVARNLMRRWEQPWGATLECCLPEFRPSEAEVLDTTMRSATLIGLNISEELEDMDPYDLTDAAEFEPIAAPAVQDTAIGEQEAIVARRFPAAVAAKLHVEFVRPWYRRWNMYPEFISMFTLMHRRMYRTPAADSAPDVYYKVHKETQLLWQRMRTDTSSDACARAFDQCSRVPDRLASLPGAESFENWFTSWFGHMLLDWGQLTQVQAAIAEMAMGNLSRVPELVPTEMAVMMLVLGGFGIGKSEVTKILQQCWPTAGHSEASQTASKYAHLQDRIAQIMFMDEYDPTTETLELRTRAMMGITRHLRHEQDAEGNWGNKLYEHLNVPNLFASGNTAPGGAIADRAQIYVVPSDAEQQQPGASHSTRTKVMAPNRPERRSLLMIGRWLNGCKYEYYEGVNMGAWTIDRSMIHVLLAVAEKVLGERFRQLSLRQIAQVKAAAVALFVKDTTALYHLKIKPTTEGANDRHMWDFYGQYSVVQMRHGLTALERVFKYSDQSSVTAKVVGALRAHVRYAAGQHMPLRCEHDERYFELDVQPGNEVSAITASLRKYGRGVVEDAMRRLRQTKWQGADVLKVVGARRGKTSAVLADFVLRPEVQTAVGAALWDALQWLFCNCPDTWRLDFETEAQIVFTQTARNMIRSGGRDDSGVQVPPSLQQHLNSDTVRREFAMLGLTGEFVYDEVPAGTAISKPISVWCAEVVQPPEDGGVPVGEKVIEGGNISYLHGGNDDLYKRRQLQACCLSVSWDAIQRRIGADSSDSKEEQKMGELRQWALAIEGAMMKNEKYVPGLNSSGPNLIEKHKYCGWPGASITIDNPNRSVTARGGHTVCMPESWDPDKSAIDEVLPRTAAEITFTPQTSLWDLIHAQHCLFQTGMFPAQEWERRVAQYPSRPAVVTVDGIKASFRISKRESNLRGAVLRHTFNGNNDASVFCISPRRFEITPHNAADVWGLSRDKLIEIVVATGAERPEKRLRL